VEAWEEIIKIAETAGTNKGLPEGTGAAVAELPDSGDPLRDIMDMAEDVQIRGMPTRHRIFAEAQRDIKRRFRDLPPVPGPFDFKIDTESELFKEMQAIEKEKVSNLQNALGIDPKTGKFIEKKPRERPPVPVVADPKDVDLAMLDEKPPLEAIFYATPKEVLEEASITMIRNPGAFPEKVVEKLHRELRIKKEVEELKGLSSGNLATVIVGSKFFNELAFNLPEWTSRKGIHPIERIFGKKGDIDIMGEAARRIEMEINQISPPEWKEKLARLGLDIGTVLVQFAAVPAAPEAMLAKLPAAIRPMVAASWKFGLREAMTAPRAGETLGGKIGSIGVSTGLGLAVGAAGKYIPKARYRIPTEMAGFGALAKISGASNDEALETMVSVLGFELFGLAKGGLKKGKLKLEKKITLRKLYKANPDLRGLPEDALFRTYKGYVKVATGQITEQQWGKDYRPIAEALLREMQYQKTAGRPGAKGPPKYHPFPPQLAERIAAEHPDIAQKAIVSGRLSRGDLKRAGITEVTSAAERAEAASLLQKGLQKPVVKPQPPAPEVTEQRRMDAIEHLADTSRQWQELEDKLMEISETDPEGKTDEYKKIDAQMEKLIKDYLAKQQAAEPAEEKPEPTPINEVTEKVKRHAIEILPRKDEILAEIKAAIEKAPEKATGKKDMLHFEIDGGINVYNTKAALQKVYDKVKATPEKEWWPQKKAKITGKKKPIAGKQEKIDRLIYAPEGYFTDGRILVKGRPPAKAKYEEGTGTRYSREHPMEQSRIDEILNEETKPAELVHYAWRAPEVGKGISARPIKAAKEDEPGAMAVFQAEGRYYAYDQNRFNVIRNRFPETRYGINTDKGLLVAYDQNNKPVAAMMPINIGEKEGQISSKEPPVDMTKTLKEEADAAALETYNAAVKLTYSTDYQRNLDIAAASGKVLGKTSRQVIADLTAAGVSEDDATAAVNSVYHREAEPPEVEYEEEKDTGEVGGEAYVYKYEAQAPLPGKPGGPAKPPPDERNASDNAVFGLTELVELAKQLNEGRLPKVVKALRAARGQALGYFQHDKIKGRIKLRHDIFIGPVIKSVLVNPNMADAAEQKILWELINLAGIPEDEISVRRHRDKKTRRTRLIFYRKDPDFAARVLSHEIGHLVDWLPEKTLGRGNILGRIASLKNFLDEQMAGWPGGPGPLTESDKRRLRKIAEDMLSRTYEVEVDEIITKRLEITPDDVLAIWNSTMDQRKIAPELYKYIAGMSRAEKKSIMAEAMRARAGKGKLRDELKQFAKEIREKTGRKIKQVVGGEVTPEKLEEKYRELFTEEIRKRQLLFRDQVMEELKALTKWWSPFNEAADPRYAAYRYKAKELYAEAISVLLNNPAALQSKAPEFYRGFFNWLENKPEMKRLYQQITDEIHSGKSLKNAVMRMRRGFREAEKRHAELLKGRGITKETVVKGFKVALSDVHSITKGAARPLRRSGQLPPEKDPEYAIDSAVYSNAEHEAYLVKIKWRVAKRLTDVNLTWEDFDEYLTHLRIIHERGEMANPFGFTPKTSQQRIDEMKEEFGPEKFKALENAQKHFWQIRKDMVIEKARNSAMFDDELMKYIEDNEHYVTFEVVNYIDKKYGRGMGARIYQQVGTLSPITGGATATLLKDASLMRAMNWNEAKRSTVQMLQEFYPGEIQEAKQAFGRYIEPKDPDKRLVFFMHKGKLHGYNVDKWIAQGFQRDENQVVVATSLIFRSFAMPFKAVFTGLNPGFWTFNIKRDIDRAIKNLPQAGSWNWIKTAKNVPNSGLVSFIKRYREAIKPAFRSVYGLPDAVVQRMLENRMLISVADYAGYTAENKMLDRLLTMYTGAKGGKWDNMITRPAIKMMHHFLRLGEAIERIPKVAAYKYLKEAYPDMPDALIEDFVRTKAGSPSFLTKGVATPITNSIFLFSNPAIQGWKSDFEVWRARPGEQAMNMSKYVWLPKALTWLFTSGALVSFLLWLHDGDEENEQVKAARFIQGMFANIPEYDLCNYHCIPLGMTPQGKTVYFRIPMDEGQRLFGGVAWKLLNAQKHGLKTPLMALDYTADQMPGLHPGIKIALAAWDYMNGVNPYDRFRDRRAIPEQLFKARTKETHLAMAKWMANQAGASIIYRFKTEEPGKVKTELEKILGYPIVGNIAGRWVKVSDYGKAEIVREAREYEEKKRAKEILKLRKIVDKKLAGEKLTPEEERFAKENKQYIRRREKRAKITKAGDVYERQLLAAGTQRAKDAIHLRILEIEGPGFDLTPYIEQDIISKAKTLSRPVPLRKSEKAAYWKDVNDTLTWYRQRNVSKATIHKLFRQYLRENIKSESAQIEKMDGLNYRLRKL